MEMTTSGGQMIWGLLIGIALLVFMITRTRINAFFALIIVSILTAFFCGVPAGNVVKVVTSGFGNTLASVGIIVGLGILLGEVFDMSGAALKMANVFMRIFGKGREEWALALTGFIVSIPIFADSAMLLLFPIARAIAKKTGKSIVMLGMCMMYSMVITHTLIPPTPGPLAAADQFGVSVGSILMWGIVMAIPITIAVVFYYKYFGPKIKVNDDDVDLTVLDIDESKLPSAIASFTPILLPIFLIVTSSILKLIGLTDGFYVYIHFIGTPIIALGISLMIALLTLTKGFSREHVLDKMSKGMQAAGVILLVTGGGGALGNVLRESGAGNFVAQSIATWSIPAILIPFFIASIVRIIQGSITVSIITAASISAPILGDIPDVNMTFAALACCIGALSLTYFNDSGFWVTVNLLKLKNPKDQMIACSLQSPVAWATGFIVLMTLNVFFG